MNATNRILNRGLLLLFGLILFAAGATAVIAGIQPAWLQPIPSTVQSWGLTDLGTIRVFAVSFPAWLLILLATALILIVLLLFFIFTRGGGKTKSVLWVEAADGRTVVDRNVADAVLTAPLTERDDVLGAHADVYTVKRTRTVELDVTVRRGAPLGAVLAAAEESVTAWDALLGIRVPVMLHLTDRGWRDGMRARTRVH